MSFEFWKQMRAAYPIDGKLGLADRSLRVTMARERLLTLSSFVLQSLGEEFGREAEDLVDPDNGIDTQALRHVGEWSEAENEAYDRAFDVLRNELRDAILMRLDEMTIAGATKPALTVVRT